MSGSDYNRTPNYAFYKPVPNADVDTWGDHWNWNADTLDAVIHGIDVRPGVTSWNARTGAVTLSNADVIAVLPGAAVLPLMDGAAAAGTATTWARADHIHPVDTSRYAASNPSGFQTAAQVTAALPVASAVLPLIEGTAAIGTSAAYARADHVHPALAGGTTVTISDTAPGAPSTGAMWFDSVGTQMYLFYNDGNSAQWVPTTNQVTGIQEAPGGGVLYGRRNSAWASVDAAIVPAQNNTGRNLLHNPLFNVTQRGAGPWTANSYTADRWAINMVSDTANFAPQSLDDASRTQIGDEAATTFLAGTVTGNAAASAFTVAYQPIESVRRLAGKTVTISFWAIGTAAMKLGVSFDQYFGTGGSPSATVEGAGQSVTLTGSFARYNLTFTLPSISGKTLGTNNTDNTTLLLWYSSGTDNATRTGNIGVQSGTINLWGMQLEIGSVATPLEKPDPQQDLANCRRFYQVIKVGARGPAAGAGQWFGCAFTFSPMRATPTAVAGGADSTNNLGGSALSVLTSNSARYDVSSAAAGDTYVIGHVQTLSADL
ncbi:MAG TPA: hypothetical protein VGH84_02680 [Steroidobacteraceae bacterium]|jgi:hypothetical protein